MNFEKGETEAESFLEIEQRKAASRRDLKLVDHDEITYDVIKKNLYIESREISKLTDV